MPTSERNISQLIEGGRRLLRQSGITRYALDAELLLATVLDCDRSYLIAHCGDMLTEAQQEHYQELLQCRALGTPIQHIRGSQEFWGRDFVVNADVLIPRPETELLIEKALQLTQNSHLQEKKGVLIADIGTGSGCLAVTLAAEIRGARVYATDISLEAVQVAQENASRHGVYDLIQFLCGNAGTPLLQACGPDSFDLVVSNPPYGSEKNPQLFENEVLQFEPRRALFGGWEGTETLEKVITQTQELLAVRGFLLLEIGIGQSAKVKSFLGKGWSVPEIFPDLQGIPRVVLCRKEHR